MLERIASTVFLRPAAAEYAERAQYYKRRAVIASVSQGILDHVNGDVQGVDLVDSTDGVEILIPGMDKTLQFAFDKNGIAFARIEGGKYYPIVDSSQSNYGDAIKKNEKLARSYIRRVFNRRFESLDRALFDLTVQTDNASDHVLGTLVIIHDTLQYLKKQNLES